MQIERQNGLVVSSRFSAAVVGDHPSVAVVSAAVEVVRVVAVVSAAVAAVVSGGVRVVVAAAADRSRTGGRRNSLIDILGSTRMR